MEEVSLANKSGEVMPIVGNRRRVSSDGFETSQCVENGWSVGGVEAG